jgi:hypothetical protein
MMNKKKRRELMNYKTFGVGLLVVFLLAACSFNAVPVTQGTLEPEASYWQQQGGIIGLNECNSTPALANDGTNNVIAYCDFSAGVVVKKWNGSSWNTIGTSLGYSNQPSLALDSAGNPVLAGAEFAGSTYNISVHRFNGTAWVNVGGALSGSSAAFSSTNEPSLALTSSGNPVVAWHESDGTVSNIYVQTFNGSSWVNVGNGVLSGSSETNSNAGNPSLALDSAGNPVVAWTEFDGSINKIYVQRFNGTAWVSVGSGVLNAVGSPATNPSLALNSSGNPTVAWQEGPFSNNSNIYVQRFNGTTWVNVGAGVLDAASGWGVQPSLALNSAGSPTVAWSEFDGASFNVYVQEFKRGNWVSVGVTPLDVTLENGGGYPALALVNGSLNVAWLENFGSPITRVYVKSYVKNGWQPLGDALDTSLAQNASTSSVARKSNNNPVVAWQEFDGTSNNVYVKEWSGSAWSSVGGTLDRTLTNNAQNPSLALRSDNRPTVAWQENNNVYVKRWNNSSWVSIGGALDSVPAALSLTPSLVLDSANVPIVAYAENGDILVKKPNEVVATSVWGFPFGTAALDTNATVAYRPSIALKSDGNPIVAWYENDGSSTNVYAKEWTGTAWIALGTTLDMTASNNAKDAVLAIRSDNRPVVAWEEAGNIYVKQWNGSAWQSVGGVLDKVAANEALRPALDLRSDNNPVVTWQEGSSTNYNIFVKRWTGSAWANVSSSALDKTLSRTAQRPAVVLKSNNNPLVAWDESDGASENVYVEQY